MKKKTVNSVSGGKTSAYIAVKYPADYNVFSLVCIDDKESIVKDKHVLQYSQDKLQRFNPEFGEFIATAEDDKTLRAMMDLEQLLGSEITWVRGMSFDDLIDKGLQTRLPSWARRFCTDKMKLLPIFLWWFFEINEKCNMRIGFRTDEFDRMIRFFNNSDPTNYSIPTYCKTYGNKQQKHTKFNWRFCEFPLIKDQIYKEDIERYWSQNKLIKGDLFTEDREIEFPVISNCVGCFHKSPETLSAMAEINFSKMQWFANQELKDMGTWLDSKVTYQHLIDNREDIYKETLYEILVLGQSCDSGGCTD